MVTAKRLTFGMGFGDRLGSGGPRSSGTQLAEVETMV